MVSDTLKHTALAMAEAARTGPVASEFVAAAARQIIDASLQVAALEHARPPYRDIRFPALPGGAS